MMKYIVHLIKKWRQFIKFSIVGVLNTALSYILMLAAYHFLGMGYWGSSSAAYLAGAVFSFVLNKKFTFQNNESAGKTAVKYGINIAVCYVLSYGLAKAAISRMFELIGGGAGVSVVDQISMVCGMLLYILLNYLGQAKFVFKKR